MTNGEKFKEVFKISQVDEGQLYAYAWLPNHEAVETSIDWWNAEYKDPNSDIRLNRVENELNQDKNELEPTTKNDLPHCHCTDTEIAKSFIEDVEAVKEQLPCGEQMDFPNTFDEFANEYGFKDKDEIYTNGSELIPVFRVKQWLEHISTTKNDLGVECISRQSVLDKIQRLINAEQNNIDENGDYMNYARERVNAYEAIQFFVENDCLCPSVTPQEPRVDFEELKRRIFMEVDGGTDDKWLRYTDVCDRISDSIDKFVVDMKGEEE